MIQTIFAFFGYVKIPLAVVQLSIAQEEFLKKMLKHESDHKGKEYLSKHMEGQKVLTTFLRSGRF